MCAWKTVPVQFLVERRVKMLVRLPVGDFEIMALERRVNGNML